MSNRLFLFVGLLSFAIFNAQAETLNINATHQQANDVEVYLFENTSAGNVRIVMDTLQDGFDASLVIWKQKNIPSAEGQPQNSGWGGASQNLGSDWGLIEIVGGAPRAEVNSPQNIYGIPVKNGYEAGGFFMTGTSDPGVDLVGLSAGVYLITVNGTINNSFAKEAGDSITSGSFELEQLSNNTYPHDYKFTVSGDFVAEYVPAPVESNQIPLPGMVLWLMGMLVIGVSTYRSKIILKA